MRLALCAGLILFSALPWITGAEAQSLGEFGSIAGVVIDASGAVIRGTQVTATNDSTGKQYSQITEADGVCRLEGLVPGSYSVHFAARGFKPETRTSIQVSPNRVTPMEITLAVGTYSGPEIVAPNVPVIVDSGPMIVTGQVGAAQNPQANSAHEPLRAPVLIWPLQGAEMHTHRRLIDFKWTEVEGASSYTVEIDSFRCPEKGGWCSDEKRTGYLVRGVETPELFFNFCCSTPGRWRVWASAASGEGAKSEWREFTFASTPGAKTDPPLPSFDQPLPQSDCSWRSALAHPEPGTIMPSLVWAPDPEYAVQNRINAVASLEVKVAPDGTVEAVCLLDAPRADLAETAIQAVRIWRFQPATLNGQTVPGVAHLEIRFRACCAQTALLYPPPRLDIGEVKMLQNGPCASWLRPVLPATMRPRAVYSPIPSYTNAARKMKVNGEVGVVLKLDRTGSVEGVCVAKSLAGDLDESAVRTIKTWRFEPAQRNGIAVPYVTYVTVSFKLY